MKMKRKKPVFIAQGGKNLKRVGDSWRRPHGKHSKLRTHNDAKGFLPQKGYGSPKSVRYFHPSGFEEVMVYNVNDLENIDSQKQACRIASSVGRKKRIDIMKKSEEKKIKVLNPLKIETKNVESVDKK